MIKMTPLRAHSPKHCTPYRPTSESGIALITVLFLMILMSILGLTMVVSVNSDMMINGYYGNSRAAYYAADSGINLSRQYLSNQIQLQTNAHPCLGWGANAAAWDSACVAAPLDPITAATTALANLQSTYGSFTAVNTGNAAQSRPSFFQIQNDTASTCTNSFSIATGSPVITQSTLTYNLITKTVNTNYAYTFNYVLCSVGRGSLPQRSVVKEVGILLLNVQAQDKARPTFAGYGQFVDQQVACPGSWLTPGTYTGPSFTNGAWTLGRSGSYLFTDPLQQAGPKIGYYASDGSCKLATSVPLPGITATFPNGVSLGMPPIPLPTNSYNQKWAVLDGRGCGETTGPSCDGSVKGSAPTTAQLAATLKDVSKAAYSGTSGVFLPWYTDTTTGVNTYGSLDTGGSYVSGGGIIVKGNASILLAPGTDASNNPTQVYTITQGVVVTTVTINPLANTTTLVSGAATKTLAGIPANLANGLIPTTASAGAAGATPTMLYVDGTITGLTGPGEGLAAIQNNNMVTIAGSSDINITGDLIYKTAPITKNPADTLLLNKSTSSSYQTLGVFTTAGSIILNSPYADHNLETDGALAAIGDLTTDSQSTTGRDPGLCTASNCGFKVSNHIETWNNVGGQIQTNQFVADLNTANTYFDQRFKAWQDIGFAPPWFPSTNPAGTLTAPVNPKLTPTQQRASWAWLPQ